MRRITRYVLSDLIKVFAVTLAGMTLLMILVGLAQEAIRQGLGPVPILRLVPYVLPNALRFAVPGTILFAACSVYGRMSAANEVVAIKSLGISPMVVVWPALLLSFVISLVAVWLNDVAVSWGRKGVNRVILESVDQIAYGMLRTRRSYSTKKFAIAVQRVEGRKLVNPILSFHATESAPAVTITAEHAELRINSDKNTLGIVLHNSEFELGKFATGQIPETIVHEVPLAAASHKGERGGGPSALPLWRIPGEVEAQQTKIRELEQSLATEAAYQMLTGDFQALTSSQWQEREWKLQQVRFALFRLHTEPWRRWANGFSCFFFVMVGAPLAIRLRNADFWTSFGLCFLPILLIYYPLLIYGVDRAKSGELPPFAVWAGNVVLLMIGAWLLRKVIRY